MSTAVVTPHRHRRRIVLSALDSPGQVLEHITPNWFASVMGTGIVANAAATLPLRLPGLHVFATVIWILASAALVMLTVAFLAHWLLHRANARGYAGHPVASLFYGAPPMALLTVAGGTLLVGKDIVGDGLALGIATSLWIAGTALGLATCVWIPRRMIKAGDHLQAVPLPAWLMPVVPPMVSATVGALLLPHITDTGLRTAFLWCCYGLFAVSLSLGGVVLTLIARRGVVPALQAVPTVWITLGMVGQSITAANLLGGDAHTTLGVVFGIVYGLIAGSVGAGMFALAVVLTVRAARAGLTFTLTWWSFTFPVGTCVTGATALGTALGSGALEVLAICLYAVLLAAWGTVASKTLVGSFSGRIFVP